ncbi:TniQ family protein [Streptomyces sp. ISL-100]|uniref:TniQ family protein n=1 Tax=Streptomyces sp. ISL-100 TaxID=2819173 RepID=UPI001BE92F9D|nr:TniQ family protein [Streptomyces sp. ISL-100]MBT2401381.1 TniQ family protein [Streptomyces sp. ISL-100]
MTRTPPSYELARSLAPLPGESLPGLLLRLSFRLDRSPLRIADLCGLRNGHHTIPYPHLRALSGELTQRFSQAARLTEVEVRALTMQPLAGKYPLLNKLRVDSHMLAITARTHWAMSASSRYCPQCLQGDGSSVQNALGGPWQLRWHLPVVFACLPHRRLLECTCPGCGNLLNGVGRSSSGLIEQPGLTGLHPAQCRSIASATDPPESKSARNSPPCGTRLDESPASTPGNLNAQDLGRLLSLQIRLNERLSAHPPVIARPDPLAASFFADLVTATHLIKLSWPAGENLLPSADLASAVDARVAPLAAERSDSHTGHKLTGARTAPEDAVQCAALLLAAETLLGDRELTSLRSRIQPLTHEANKRYRPYTKVILKDRGISTVLSRAAARRIHGAQVHINLRRTAGKYRFQVDEVPPFLPRAWFDAHFAAFTQAVPSFRRVTERHLRRAASFRLAELRSGARWYDCAPALGVLPSCGRNTLKVLGRQLNGAHLWPAFEEVVDGIARELDERDDRVDYANRRRMMANWRLNQRDWLAMREGLPGLGETRVKADPSVGAVVVWCSITQAERHRSPVMSALRHEGLAKEMLSGLSTYFDPGPPHSARFRLRQRLDFYAALLGQTCDQGGELHVDVADVIRAESTANSAVKPR